MPVREFAPPTSWRGGASLRRGTIKACVSGDEGCCLVCVTCGAEFLASVPFSDESEAKSSYDLAKQLYHHDCNFNPGQIVGGGSRAK